MIKKQVVAFTFVVAMLGSQHGRAQNPAGDYLYTGSTGVANPLKYSGSAPNGVVNITCVANNAPLGGYAGSVTSSTTKGNPGSGICPSDYIVTGSVQGTQCAPKVVNRPQNGWNKSLHYAHFGAVLVADNNVTCSMGGE